MTVITWGEFPKMKDSARGQDMSLVGSEMFLPPPYAKEKRLFGQTTRIVIKIGVLTGGFLLVSEMDVLAAGSLDEKAKELYKKFLSIAKWIIAGKGGWETINKMLKEDFDGAKKSFLQYVIIFGILIGLPKALDYVEIFFEE